MAGVAVHTMMPSTTAGPQNVDEIGLIRRQCATEHAHLTEAAQRLATMAASSGNISERITVGYCDYLIYYLKRAIARCEAMTTELLARGTPALSDAERSTLKGMEPLRCATLARLAQLEDAGPIAAAARASEATLEGLRQMRTILEPLAERHFGLSEWRRVAHFSADSVLEERRRFQELLA